MVETKLEELRKLRESLKRQSFDSSKQLRPMGLQACNLLKELMDQLPGDGENQYLQFANSFEEDYKRDPQAAKQILTDLIFAIDLCLYTSSKQVKKTRNNR